jgi:hypothetical protein
MLYYTQDEYTLALRNADHALELDSNDPRAYAVRVLIHTEVPEFRDCELARADMRILAGLEQDVFDESSLFEALSYYCPSSY